MSQTSLTSTAPAWTPRVNEHVQVRVETAYGKVWVFGRILQVGDDGLLQCDVTGLNNQNWYAREEVAPLPL